MNYRKAVKLWFLLIGATLLPITIFNWYIDPLWCFSHSNRFNNHQPGFNERQQKTNRIYFTGLEQYDTLMLGSSRTAYVNQYDFKGMKVFNYAADNMLPWEYEHWIDIAMKIKGKPFKNIILGIDFFGSAKNYDVIISRFYRGKVPENYIDKTIEPIYRLKSLLNFDALKHSFESIKRTFHPTISDYDRKNVRHCNIIVPGMTKQQHIQKDINEYKVHLTTQYRYRTEWKEMLERMKKRYPKTRFIIFTTPVSKPFFETFIIEAGHIDDYKRWLHESVEVFGQLYHFMDLNEITCNLDNFFDAHHLYASAAKLLAHRISGYNGNDTPENFGKLLTLKNIDSYFNHLQNTCR
ncbi:hypothetical protein [Hydrogenimonas cancrithermarum]|uniref:SGNH/GDSL hydrolase family protein n=1 Tax=Hydrogenimonas cancrithermarum TaxID=2993563 RepID=A0ABM8FP05_9BACT|nr:hypothetical protein [Hydrogenimonas cancrithermarum]BDY13581.1 hypothetical protein HCR_18930 [Hydrogenimonas cancrithermarum]